MKEQCVNRLLFNKTCQDVAKKVKGLAVCALFVHRKDVMKAMYFFISILIVSIFCISEGHDTALAADEDKEYHIGSQDLLQIKVYDEPELDREVRVSSSGEISLPLVGKVKVGGMTVDYVQELLTQLYEKDYLYNPQVTVLVKEYSTISVLGEVKNPGAYPLRGEMTILEAISLAGGFTEIAAKNGVKLLRSSPDGTKEVQKIRVGDLMQKEDKKKDVNLKRGDVVIVPESIF